jgi:hypothetical protein
MVSRFVESLIRPSECYAGAKQGRARVAIAVGKLSKQRSIQIAICPPGRDLAQV